MAPITFEKRAADLRLKQFYETIDILNSTSNIETFLGRFSFALTVCDDLYQYVCAGLLKNISPLDKKAELIENLPTSMNACIIRCHEKEIAKVNELKTDTGKRNRLIRFYNNLSKTINLHGSDFVTETNIATINSLTKTDGVYDDVSIELTPVTLSFLRQVFNPTVFPICNLEYPDTIPDNDNTTVNFSKLDAPEPVIVPEPKKLGPLQYFFIILSIVLLLENILLLFLDSYSFFVSIFTVVICIYTYKICFKDKD